MAYFVGEALWTYLNTPFLYALGGFTTEEIPSIQVEGETWRRLKVTFPDNDHALVNGVAGESYSLADLSVLTGTHVLIKMTPT